MAKVILENGIRNIHASPRFWLHCMLNKIEIFYMQSNISLDTYWKDKTFLYLGYGYSYYKEEYFEEIYLRKDDTIFYINDSYSLRIDQIFIDYFIKNKDSIYNYNSFSIIEVPEEYISYGSFVRILTNEVFIINKFNKIYGSKKSELHSLIKNGAIEWT